MFLDILSIIFITIYIYVLFYMIQKDDYTTMLIATLVVCILLCYRRRGGLQFIESFSPGELSYVNLNSVQSDNSMPKYFEGVLDDVRKDNL